MNDNQGIVSGSRGSAEGTGWQNRTFALGCSTPRVSKEMSEGREAGLTRGRRAEAWRGMPQRAAAQTLLNGRGANGPCLPSLGQAVQEAVLGGEVAGAGGWAAAMERQQGAREEHCTESLEVLAHDPVASLAGGSEQVTPALCSWFSCFLDALPGRMRSTVLCKYTL